MWSYQYFQKFDFFFGLFTNIGLFGYTNSLLFHNLVHVNPAHASLRALPQHGAAAVGGSALPVVQGRCLEAVPN